VKKQLSYKKATAFFCGDDANCVFELLSFFMSDFSVCFGLGEVLLLRKRPATEVMVFDWV
jgi:hypothetical protein